MTDLEGSRVLEVTDGNDKQSAAVLWQCLPEDVTAGLEAVAADMSGHFGASVADYAPQADLVHDRYHISAHLNKAVSQVVRAENKRLQAMGDERLKGTQRLFGYNPDHLREEDVCRFSQLRHSDLKSARAWAIKENFRRFWDFRYEANARKFFAAWYGWLAALNSSPSRRWRKPSKTTLRISSLS